MRGSKFWSGRRGVRTRFSFTAMPFMDSFLERWVAPTVALVCESNWPLMKRLVSEVLPSNARNATFGH